MAMKKFEMDRNPIWKPENAGDQLEGIFISRRMVSTPNGESSINTIETGGDEKKDVWGNTILDNFFGNIPVGSQVSITYLGKATNPNTKRSYHNYDLMYDESIVSTVQAASNTFGAKVSEDPFDGFDSEEEAKKRK